MKTNKTIALLVGGIALFLVMAYVFSNIFIYFVLAIVLSALLRPITNRLSQIQIFSLRMPRVLSVLISFLIFGLLVSVFVLLFIPLITEQTSILFSLNYDDLLNMVLEPVNRLEAFLIEKRLLQSDAGLFAESINQSISNFSDEIKIQRVLNDVLSFTGSFSIGLLAVTFITFFLLYEKGLIRKQLINLIPNQYFEVSIAAVSKVEKLLSNYLIGLLVQMLSIFSLASLGLSIFGIKYALTIGLFAALANLIPYAGPILGATFGIIVGVSTMDVSFGSPEFLWLIIRILSVFAVVQVTDNLVLQPLIFSRSVKVHPLEIFVIIFAGATLGGIPGMIAAIPVYTIIRVSFVELYKGYREYHIFKI
jgi:predicted PurR-regulated permease PerM